ncbi:hypothetical protein [Nonomuraea dietziae]|uniref:hypothetical protein n=1 Tax=Nonomuraea dietziae TaxID=65515 RepID=UPI0031D457C9
MPSAAVRRREPTGRQRPPVPDADPLPVRGRFGRFDFGYASATAWLMFVVIVMAAGINYLFVRRIRSS